jgi:hypothetical protein
VAEPERTVGVGIATNADLASTDPASTDPATASSTDPATASSTDPAAASSTDPATASSTDPAAASSTDPAAASSTAAGGGPAPAEPPLGHASVRSVTMPGSGSVPLQRDTDDGRHRVGVPVTAVIAQAGGATSDLARRGGAHRIMRRTGRHSGRHRATEETDAIARRSIDDVDAMAHRRSIGNRLTRGIGRTAL